MTDGHHQVVTLQLKDDGGSKVSVPALALMCSSPVLQRAIALMDDKESGILEVDGDPKGWRLATGILEKNFHSLSRGESSAATASSNIRSVDDVVHVLPIAQMYDIPSLVNACIAEVKRLNKTATIGFADWQRLLMVADQCQQQSMLEFCVNEAAPFPRLRDLLFKSDARDFVAALREDTKFMLMCRLARFGPGLANLKEPGRVPNLAGCSSARCRRSMPSGMDTLPRGACCLLSSRLVLSRTLGQRTLGLYDLPTGACVYVGEEPANTEGIVEGCAFNRRDAASLGYVAVYSDGNLVYTGFDIDRASIGRNLYCMQDALADRGLASEIPAPVHYEDAVAPSSMAFLDNQLVALAYNTSEDETAYVLDIEAGGVVCDKLAGAGHAVYPSGRRGTLLGAVDNTVKLWDAKAGLSKPVAQQTPLLPGGRRGGGSIVSVAQTGGTDPATTLLADGSGNVWAWDMRRNGGDDDDACRLAFSAECSHRICRSCVSCNAVAVHVDPEGGVAMLVRACGTIDTWNLATGQLASQVSVKDLDGGAVNGKENGTLHVLMVSPDMDAAYAVYRSTKSNSSPMVMSVFEAAHAAAAAGGCRKRGRGSSSSSPDDE